MTWKKCGFLCQELSADTVRRLHKTKYEFGEIINRVIVGFIIPVVGVVATLTDKSVNGFKFAASNWLIPLVLFGFLVVVVLDNVILSVAFFTDKHRKRSSRWTDTTYVRTPNNEDDDMVKFVGSSTLELRKSRFDDNASMYSRHTSYQPYDADTARAVLSDGEGTPRSGRNSRAPSPRPLSFTPGSGRNSRAPSPQPPPQIPINIVMQDNFRPSHVRTRSAGYAAVGVDDFDDYMDTGAERDGNTLRVSRERSPSRHR